MITLYSKPNCPDCDLTKRDMGILGIEYEEVDITKDEASLNELISLGFKAAPVVKTEKEAWSGYDQEKIKGLMTYEPEVKPFSRMT